MASSSSTNPLFEQVDRRVTFQNLPDSLNTSNQMMATNVFQTDIPQANFPMIPEARFTHHHQKPPVAVQDSFQPQNLQSHQEQFNSFHGDSLSEDNHSDQENWDVQDYANNDVQNQLYPNHSNQGKRTSVCFQFLHEETTQPGTSNDPNAKKLRADFMNPRHQFMNRQLCEPSAYKAMKDQPGSSSGPSSFDGIPGSFMNHQEFEPTVFEAVENQPGPSSGSSSFHGIPENLMNSHKQLMNRLPANMVPVANHQISQPGMLNDLIPENVYSNCVNPRNQLVNGLYCEQNGFEAMKDQPGPLSGTSSFHGIPDNFINPQKHYQSTSNGNKASSSTNFMNPNIHFTNPQMPQKLIPGAPSHQGTSSDFHSGQMNHNNMVPYQLTNQMPQQLALGLNQNYPSNWYAPAQQNMVASSTTPNPITFFLLNSKNWQYLNSLTNEMMVTNDGRGIFPRFEIGIRNLNPTASYHVGIKLHLVSSKKFSYNVERYEWMEVDPRKSEELPEQETNEIHTPVQTGQEIMDSGLKLKTVNIYSIGNEKKKRGATKGVMTEERVKKLERKERIRRETMMRVFPQRKYMPIFTLYRLTDFGVREPVTTAQFPETEFITTTEYKNKSVKDWKTNKNPYVRPGYRTSKI